MEFQKPTPKWFLTLYPILLTLLGIFSIALLFQGIISTPFVSWYTMIFVIFNMVMLLAFLGSKYELRSWAVPLCFLVFGFVSLSLINSFSGYTAIEGIYFLHFIKTVFLWMFIILVNLLYWHPHVKRTQEFRKKDTRSS